MAWFFGRKKDSTPPPPRAPPKIRRDVIDLICQVSRSQHPNEFGGLLRAEKEIINELLVLPGTVSGRTHATFQLGMMPIDFSVRGTVHSHPGSVPLPSDADLDLFRKYGRIHIIIAEPYTPRTWRGYDGRGDSLRIEVVEK